MGQIAFVFSGQGAQYSGMGKSLYENSAAARALYNMAEEIRPGTMAQSFSGTDAELKETAVTQPCLFLVDLAAALALEEVGIHADMAAGFSLGEVAALAFGGAYTHADGFRIVCERGKLMAKAGSAAETAMCAVLRLDHDIVRETASQFSQLYAVNFNCPGQTSVSGLKSSMEAFTEKIKEMRGRCVPLAVSAAFHSPFMDTAAEGFAAELAKYPIAMPQIPVYANLTAQPYRENVAETLCQQINHPVRWEETIQAMLAQGVTDFIEVGAGKTLCGLIRKISSEAHVYSVENAETLEITRKAVLEQHEAQ